MSRFTDDLAADLIDAVADGLTIAEAALRCSVPTNTVKSWLRRGRRENDTPLARFAAEVDEARERVASAPLTEEEFLGCVARSVRAGSVAAMRLWHEIHAEERGRPPDRLDELQARFGARRAASSGNGSAPTNGGTAP